MIDLFDAANGIAANWAEAVWRASWQGAAAISLAWTVCRLFRVLPGAARAWLWRLAYLKVAVALFWATPIDLPVLPASMGPTDPARTAASAGGPATREPVHPADATAAPAPAGGELLNEGTSPSLGRASTAAVSPVLGLLLLWAAGVAWCTVRVAFGWRRAMTLRRACRPLRDTETEERLALLCARFQVPRPPGLLDGAVTSPLLLGALRPALVLPRDLEVTEGELNLILAHELAHLRRGDLLWAWLPVVLRCLLFFHPLVWVAHREWRLAQEMACDEMAVRVTRADAGAYGELLVRLAARRSSFGDWGLGAVGLLGPITALEARVSSLVCAWTSEKESK